MARGSEGARGRDARGRLRQRESESLCVRARPSTQPATRSGPKPSNRPDGHETARPGVNRAGWATRPANRLGPTVQLVNRAGRVA